MSSKGKLIMQWALILLIAFQFFIVGFSKLNGQMLSAFESWGYSPLFMYLVGGFEVLTAMGLFFSKTRNASGLAQIVIMLGALYTHWLHAELFQMLINVGIIGLCAIIIWLEQEKIMVSHSYEKPS